MPRSNLCEPLRHRQGFSLRLMSMDWTTFIRSAPSAPHETAKSASEYFLGKDVVQCLDLGCGNGRDSLFFAHLGFSVTANDLSLTVSQAATIDPRIKFIEGPAEDLPLSKYDIINASLFFPFLPEDIFHDLWRRLIDAIKPGGVIAGHFFGADDWKVRDHSVWSVDNDKLNHLLSGLYIAYLKETKIDGLNNAGNMVHKHNYAFVARKPL
jgi:tellurite methyltransferase